MAGYGLTDSAPPPELQPWTAGVALEYGVPWWWEPSSPTVPTKSTTTAVWNSGVEQWRPLVEQYFAPDEVETALCIMSHESGGNPNAKNPHSTASGLFQHLASWWDYFDFDPFDPEQSIQAAKQLKDLYGWTQWSPYKRGSCRGI